MFRLSSASASLPLDFDSAASSPRLILLVSPTRPVCLAGVDLVLEALDARLDHRSDDFVVWLPVLDAGDESAAAVVAGSKAPCSSITRYWDNELTMSSAVHAALDFEARARKTAWELYLSYRSDTRWSEPYMRS